MKTERLRSVNYSVWVGIEWKRQKELGMVLVENDPFVNIPFLYTWFFRTMLMRHRLTKKEWKINKVHKDKGGVELKQKQIEKSEPNYI